MRIHLPNSWRLHFIFMAMAAMLVSVFTTRALLSVSIMAFIGVTLLHKNIGKQVLNFLQNPLLLSISILFFIPLFSGLWSADLHKWNNMMRIKLPLLFLPVAFAGNWQLTHRQWRILAILFLILTIGGTCWSTFQYIPYHQAINQDYLKAKLIPTPLENDHVRFSWLVCAAVMIGCAIIDKVNTVFINTLLITAIVWLVVYLHILAARTGLLSFYLFLFIAVVWIIVKKENRTYRLPLILILFLMPLAAWFLFPTFQNRIHYFVYDFSYVKGNTYLPGASDGNRLQSLKAGWTIVKQYPLGVGAGDVENETRNWYAAHVPNMHSSDQLALPSSEWLIYGAMAGWAGIILFTAAMLIPISTTVLQNRLYWLGITITAACSFLFDIGLEVQYGVFLYTFLVLWCWKWFSIKSISIT